MAKTLDQVRTVSVGDVEMAAVDCTPWLDSGELLTGSVTVQEITTDDLTLENASVSTEELTVMDVVVAIGKAIQFKVDAANAVADTVYRVRFEVNTNASPARKIIRDVLFKAM